MPVELYEQQIAPDVVPSGPSVPLEAADNTEIVNFGRSLVRVSAGFLQKMKKAQADGQIADFEAETLKRWNDYTKELAASPTPDSDGTVFSKYFPEMPDNTLLAKVPSKDARDWATNFYKTHRMGRAQEAFSRANNQLVQNEEAAFQARDRMRRTIPKDTPFVEILDRIEMGKRDAQKAAENGIAGMHIPEVLAAHVHDLTANLLTEYVVDQTVSSYPGDTAEGAANSIDAVIKSATTQVPGFQFTGDEVAAMKGNIHSRWSYLEATNSSLKQKIHAAKVEETRQVAISSPDIEQAMTYLEKITDLEPADRNFLQNQVRDHFTMIAAKDKAESDARQTLAVEQIDVVSQTGDYAEARTLINTGPFDIALKESLNRIVADRENRKTNAAKAETEDRLYALARTGKLTAAEIDSSTLSQEDKQKWQKVRLEGITDPYDKGDPNLEGYWLNQAVVNPREVKAQLPNLLKLIGPDFMKGEKLHKREQYIGRAAYQQIVDTVNQWEKASHGQVNVYTMGTGIINELDTAGVFGKKDKPETAYRKLEVVSQYATFIHNNPDATPEEGRAEIERLTREPKKTFMQNRMAAWNQNIDIMGKYWPLYWPVGTGLAAKYGLIPKFEPKQRQRPPMPGPLPETPKRIAAGEPQEGELAQIGANSFVQYDAAKKNWKPWKPPHGQRKVIDGIVKIYDAKTDTWNN